jgi:hypothetical protein
MSITQYQDAISDLTDWFKELETKSRDGNILYIKGIGSPMEKISAIELTSELLASKDKTLGAEMKPNTEKKKRTKKATPLSSIAELLKLTEATVTKAAEELATKKVADLTKKLTDLETEMRMNTIPRSEVTNGNYISRNSLNSNFVERTKYNNVCADLSRAKEERDNYKHSYEQIQSTHGVDQSILRDLKLRLEQIENRDEI